MCKGSGVGSVHTYLHVYIYICLTYHSLYFIILHYTTSCMYLLYICSYNILYYVFEINRIYYTTRVSIYLDIHICLCLYIWRERERVLLYIDTGTACVLLSRNPRIDPYSSWLPCYKYKAPKCLIGCKKL